MSELYNLDEAVNEHFDFLVKGHTYRFRYMTTEETEKLASFSDKTKEDKKKSDDYFVSFISPVSDNAPDFIEVRKSMIIPQWKKFREMVETEFKP